jgi:hypothetical protein
MKISQFRALINEEVRKEVRKTSRLMKEDKAFMTKFNKMFEDFYAELEDNLDYVNVDTIDLLNEAIQALEKARKNESIAQNVPFRKTDVELGSYGY